MLQAGATLTMARARRDSPVDLRDLGDALYRARTAKRLSQADVARLAGERSDSYISRIEAGKTQPSTATLLALARALDLDYQTLLVLAGHAPRPHGDQPVEFPPDIAPMARQLRDKNLPPDTWRKILITVGTWATGATRETDPEADADDHPDHRDGNHP